MNRDGFVILPGMGELGGGAFFRRGRSVRPVVILELYGRALGNIRQNPRVAMGGVECSPFEPFRQGSADALVLEDDDNMRAAAGALRAKAPQIEPLSGVHRRPAPRHPVAGDRRGERLAPRQGAAGPKPVTA
jgi:hypothetical protein